jgi:hypothetical protein
MQPLKGLTVVTLEHAIAAPYATRQLADLGARVIKIERPGTGDFARGYDARVRGLASHFVWTNRSKESLTLDVKHPEAAEVLERLVLEKADVVVQNLAPGTPSRSDIRTLRSSVGSVADRRRPRTATLGKFDVRDQAEPPGSFGASLPTAEGRHLLLPDLITPHES